VEAYFFEVVGGAELSWADEYRFRCADGSYKDVYDRGYVLRDAGGRAVRMIGAMLDITDRKRAEEALRESEHRWRNLAEALPQFVWTARPDGFMDYASAQIERYMGRPERNLLGWGWLEMLHPDDRERTRQTWRAAVEGQQSDYEIEHRFRRSDGSYLWFKTRGVAVRDSEGNVYKWFGTCTDISTDKQLEEELRLANERLHLGLRGSNIAIWEVDMPEGDFQRGRRYYVNAWEQLGYERSEVPPDAPPMSQARVHPDERAAVHEAIRRYLAGETDKFELEHRLRHKDGFYRWMLTRGVAVRDGGGKPIRFVGSAVDITDRKRLEEELWRAKEAAEAANRAKDEFLANVSHEIRTPMNAILGMTELALDTPLTDDQRQCLRTVKSAADSLLGLINDLLDFSKIEAGKLELDPGDFSLRAALGDTLRALAVRAHKKGLELACNVQPEVPDALVGDAGRLRQVLLNLVGNAIKFTELGEVVVSVGVEEPRAKPQRREEDQASPLGAFAALREVLLHFTVRDTGIGIPPDKQERIFRAFEQEDTSTTRKYGGTGLGLSIATRLVALMGGSITVHSEPGRGSAFAFTARFGRQPHPAEQTPAQPPLLLQGLPVLVVDDNPTNRHILQEWLTGWQMEPVAVGDGVAAMGALWDAVSVGRPYPLVLLDARMPDTDGLALAARIRERAALSAVRIILLTSGDRPGEPARARALRIDAHLLKPVQQDELLETIYRVMSRAQVDPPTAVEEPAREPGPVPVPAAASLHILVAEDNEFSAQLMEQLLTRRGHRVRLATNGREALAVAGLEAFDLMLLDVHMPELDGFEVVRRIRERERVAGGHLPVIALTARSRKEDREHCLAAGMDDFQTKPVSAAGLLAAIDRLVPAPGVPRPAQADAGGHVGLLDPVAVLAACGDDAEVLRGMCRAFETYLPVRLTEVGDALQAQDSPRLREAAHKLCALLFAFSTTAGNVASDLEDHAAQGRLDEARPLVECLGMMGQEIVRLAAGLSLEALRLQAEATGQG
jgi:PAS domain S-box-containing protein